MKRNTEGALNPTPSTKLVQTPTYRTVQGKIVGLEIEKISSIVFILTSVDEVKSDVKGGHFLKQ